MKNKFKNPTACIRNSCFRNKSKVSAINIALGQTESEVLLIRYISYKQKPEKAMKINELQRRLLEAYTTESLNGLSLILINLYKNQQFLIFNKKHEKYNQIY